MELDPSQRGRGEGKRGGREEETKEGREGEREGGAEKDRKVRTEKVKIRGWSGFHGKALKGWPMELPVPTSP